MVRQFVRADPLIFDDRGLDHQTMENRVLLENYYLPDHLERLIGAFGDHSNNR